MTETPSSNDISPRLRRIAELANQAPELAFTTLAHHIDIDLLREAYRRTRKDGAVGVDGTTASEYAANLEDNLLALLDRAKAGTYCAPPVRRVYIPKGDGKKPRPLGIPTFEDKVLQRAVTMVLEAVYEQDFLDCSYAYRPGRSAHQALASMRDGVMKKRGEWVLEVDIVGFFEELDHEHLRTFVRRRVRDGVLLRLVGTWLKAGVMEEGSVRRTSAGTPQGGVISPLLANLYLHEVFDRWFEDVVRPRLRGGARVVRYADDIAIAFTDEHDARRVLDVLPKRLGKYGLRLHPDKTKLVDFRRPPHDPGRGGGRGPTRTRSFTLLGFTHYWARNREGFWVVKRKTAKDRLRRSLRRVWVWCRDHRHLPVVEQHQTLARMLRGHYAFFGITGNAPSLGAFFHQVKRIWQRWLNRRSQNARMKWDRFLRLLTRYPLPRPRVVHSIYRHAAKP
jgi:RNA-directed DNA polymerase